MNKAGIYIHIPFCQSRCSYCDFATSPYDRRAAERYVRAVTREVEAFQQQSPTEEQTPDPTLDPALDVDTIYFGGGTPSLLTPAEVATILQAVHQRFRVQPGAEVTIEINPGTVTPDKLGELRRLGVNRASYGAQTFDDESLRRLGRTHTAEDVRSTFQCLSAAGFDNISFDLIAGLPAQTVAAWSGNLDQALMLCPAHLSLYLLEVHQGTPLARHIERGMWPAPCEDAAAEMYRLMVERARGAGYEHYEISSFCLPGHYARHNTKYWTGVPYYGFGCSAHSYDGQRLRWSNERNTGRYMELVEAGRSPTLERIELDAQAVESETIFLGLRLISRGVDLCDYERRFGVNLRQQHAAELRRLSEAGLIEVSGDVMKLTGAGALLSNEVLSVFV